MLLRLLQIYKFKLFVCFKASFKTSFMMACFKMSLLNAMFLSPDSIRRRVGRPLLEWVSGPRFSQGYEFLIACFKASFKDKHHDGMF